MIFKNVYEIIWGKLRTCSRSQSLELLFHYYFVLCVPLWCLDYLKLKATGTLQAQEKRLVPLHYLEEFTWGAGPTVRVITGQALPACRAGQTDPDGARSPLAPAAQTPGLLPLEPSRPHLPSLSLSCSRMTGSHTYVWNYIWSLSLASSYHVYSIIRAAERTMRVGESVFLPDSA